MAPKTASKGHFLTPRNVPKVVNNFYFLPKELCLVKLRALRFPRGFSHAALKTKQANPSQSIVFYGVFFLRVRPCREKQPPSKAEAHRSLKSRPEAQKNAARRGTQPKSQKSFQNGSNMVPQWLQNGPKVAQIGPWTKWR